MVKTHAQPYKHIIHTRYKYTEQPVSHDSNNAAHTRGPHTRNFNITTSENN